MLCANFYERNEQHNRSPHQTTSLHKVTENNSRWNSFCQLPGRKERAAWVPSHYKQIRSPPQTPTPGLKTNKLLVCLVFSCCRKEPFHYFKKFWLASLLWFITIKKKVFFFHGNSSFHLISRTEKLKYFDLYPNNSEKLCLALCSLSFISSHTPNENLRGPKSWTSCADPPSILQTHMKWRERKVRLKRWGRSKKWTKSTCHNSSSSPQKPNSPFPAYWAAYGRRFHTEVSPSSSITKRLSFFFKKKKA